MREYTLTTTVKVYQLEELTPVERNLIQSAMQATDCSYAPYSHFRVGAAALLKNDIVVTGSNQENAAYPSGLCAERTTLFYANAQYPNEAVTMLAVAARTEEGFLSQPISPCGACRQVISGVEERYGIPIRILLYGTEGIHVVDGISALLPLRFVESDMR